MTEKQLRDKVVKIAQGWIGRKEADGSHREIVDIYNGHKPLARSYKVKYTDAWCATTVSAAFIKAGLADIMPTECGCGEMVKLHQAAGIWKEDDGYRPQAGDLVFYDWGDNGKGDCTGWPDHVGIVESVASDTVRVIEGNKDDTVGRRSLSVGQRYIRGYSCPDYASKATEGLKIAPAQSRNKNLAGSYTVSTGLNMRAGAGTDKEIVKVLPKGARVRCWGYYTKNGSTVWLLVQDSTGQTGFCSKKYLR